jgi:hypothetical protein
MPRGGTKELCTVDRCERNRVGWGYCGLHYYRFIKTGKVKPSHRSQARAETMGTDGRRKCFCCGERKPFTVEFFPKDGRRPGELKGTCVACLRKARKRSMLKKLYGISLEQRDQLLQAQGNACAICRFEFGNEKKSRLMHVDHDHKTGKVRGLLCHHCNVLLGHARESIELLKSAIGYIWRTNAEQEIFCT